MGLFDESARHYLLDRASPRHGQARERIHGGAHGRFGLADRVPRYGTRVRQGSQVSVTGCGCCLPLPLLVVLSVGVVLRALWRRVR
jgi:hypothetical protein